MFLHPTDSSHKVLSFHEKMENKHKLISQVNQCYTTTHPKVGAGERQRPDGFQNNLVVCTWIGIEVKQYPSSSSSS
jgi:hypothetical protein